MHWLDPYRDERAARAAARQKLDEDSRAYSRIRERCAQELDELVRSHLLEMAREYDPSVRWLVLGVPGRWKVGPDPLAHSPGCVKVLAFLFGGRPSEDELGSIGTWQVELWGGRNGLFCYRVHAGRETFETPDTTAEALRSALLKAVKAGPIRPSED